MASNTWDIGDLVKLEGFFEVETIPGDVSSLVPIDPTTITLRTLSPKKIAKVYVFGIDIAMLRDSVGRYHVEMIPTESGLWYYRWEGTGAATAAEDRHFVVRRSEVVPG